MKVRKGKQCTWYKNNYSLLLLVHSTGNRFDRKQSSKMPEFTKRIREFLLTFVRIMMCLMVILFQLVIGQVNFRYSRWSKTALTGVSFMGHKSEFQNTSVMGCAAYCVENSPCLSFSVHRSSASCFIFSERVMFGINMTLAEGFVHYWRLSG